MMNSEFNCINLSIIAVFGTLLLASTTYRLSCGAQISPGTQVLAAQNAAGGLLIDSPGSSVIRPPFCVYPPPAAQASPPSFRPPAPYTKPEHGTWCVAKPMVASSVMQQALDYACASGADCGPIQLNGVCYQPDTVLAHASYAFNSYWQRTKRAGGTCDFGGAAMLVTVDPSYDECHFISS
ncbi:Glucan endo-1,3-beta-glucosidase 1 [Sesamum alatum]|uniref:Glucan endo-1,3-beta-glucosidase 1 n=1 Tax=Sesamum alatum TaxID=300844 RepID=A0AAE2CWV2_9LAMI|nr:Glucan endo-1,3-beta-glucosidase 1 [Sesamum alatum]